MNIAEITALIANIDKLKEDELLAKLNQIGITTKEEASLSFKGLKCLKKINKVLAKAAGKEAKLDYSRMRVPNTPFTVAEALKWLEAASADYYNYGKSGITDEEFDWIYEATKEAVPGHPFFLKRVRAVTHSDKKILLDNPVYSLFKVPLEFDKASGMCKLKESFQNLLNWMLKIAKDKSTRFYASPKFDGLTLILYYVNGILERASTGGDGIEGADVTGHAYEIQDIPKILPTGETCEIRGEALVRSSVFRALKARGMDISSARGAAVGALGLKDMTMVRERGLSFCAWGYLPHGEDFIVDEDEKFRVLRSLGFEKIGELGIVTVDDIEKIFSYYQSLDSVRKIQMAPTSPIWEDAAMDGIVVTLNSCKEQKSAGYSEIEPNFAAALKFAGEKLTTKITAIEWQVSRSGVVKPVVNFEPILLEGSCVQRATGDNFRRVDLEQMSIGCRVLVTKAGLTIPKILAVVDRQDAELFDFPKECPSCKESLVLNDGGVDLVCSNSSCPAQIFDRIRYFFRCVVSEKCGIGDSFLQTLIDSGMVKDIADLYTVSKYAIMTLDGIGESRADQFMTAMEESKQMPLSSFLMALSIFGVGEKVARKIAKIIGKDTELLLSPTALTYQLTWDRLCKIPGRKLPEIVIRNFCTWFMVQENQIMIKRLQEAGVNLLFDEAPKEENGLHFCVTGTTDMPRKELVCLLEKSGYSFDKTVNKSTDFLICNAQKSSSKLDKARRFGVTILTEVEMLARLGEKNNLGIAKQSPAKDIMNVGKEILEEKAKDLLDIVDSDEIDMFD